MERYAIGIDVHKRYNYAYMVFGEYRKTNKDIEGFIDSFNEEFRKFSSCASELLRMARQLENRDCYVLIENSTCSHDVYHILSNAGVNVTVAHATDLKQIVDSKKKTDRHDAMKLATYMRKKLNGEKEFAASYILPKVWMDRKEICRHIAEDHLAITNMKKQIRAHLAIIGNRDFDGYENILAVAARKSMRALNDKCLDYLLDKAESTMDRVAENTEMVRKELADNPIFNVIYSLPGAGILTAEYLTTVIVDIGRFPGKKQFTAFFGIVPDENDTGGNEPDGCITRRGDPMARRFIHQMTFVHIRHEEEGIIAEKYRRLRKNGKCHKETIVACSNSLLHVLFVMLTENRKFTSDPKALDESRADADAIMESEEEAS